ncbi:MAG: hypothetical protein RLN67_05975, partial [Algiphilus sp.]
TLEETREADLLLHVVDWSDPERDQRIEQVESVLREIGTEAVPRLLVCNKCDRLEGGYPARTTADLDSEGQPRRVYVSAVSGFGLDDLRATVRAFFHGGLEAVELRLRPEEARLRAQLYDVQAVTGERTGEDGTVHLQLRIPRDQLHRLCQQSGVPIERATSESVHRTGC